VTARRRLRDLTNAPDRHSETGHIDALTAAACAEFECRPVAVTVRSHHERPEHTDWRPATYLSQPPSALTDALAGWLRRQLP
jgi:hypothetical protein